MKFTKMEGCGNDYIYVDGAKEKLRPEDKPEIVRKLSDRHFGVGGDGVIFINPSHEADFEMEMYNADGSLGAMCGNGIRCVAKYVYDRGMIKKERFSIISAGQIRQMELVTENQKVSAVKVNMGAPQLVPAQIPVLAQGERAVNIPIEVLGKEYRVTCVSMGNPHAVVFMDDVEDLPIETIGPAFEHHPLFPRRVNAEFVKVLDQDTVRMRVWERGTGETLACGTGSCATAVACVLNGLTKERVTVKLNGGELEIFWDREADLIYMTGPATHVFDGEISLEKLLEGKVDE